MNSNIYLPGLEAFKIKSSTEIEGVFQIHVELERKPHCCPACGEITDKIHDYRIQRVQHIKIFA